MKTRNLFGALLCTLLSLSINAQKFTLTQLYAIADQQSKAIRISKTANVAAQAAQAEARSKRLPDVSAQLSMGYNGRGLITDRDFTNPINVYIPELSNSFSLQISQIIYAGGAISSQIKLSDMGERMTQLDLEKQKREVRFLITGQYLDICKTKNTLKVIEENIKQTLHLLSLMKANVAQGTALGNDTTRCKLQLEKLLLQQQKCNNAYNALNHALCQTLSLPDETKIEPADDLQATSLFVEAELHWQKLASENNTSVMQARLEKQMADEQLKITRSAQLPHVSLIAEDHFNGPITIEVPPINKNFNYWFVGVGVKYNLSSLYKNQHSMRKAIAQRNKAQELTVFSQEQVNTAVNGAYTDYLTACAELKTCQAEVTLANENYHLITTRYQQGLSLITEMMDASNAKLAAETECEQARIEQLFFLAKLKYLSGTI